MELGLLPGGVPLRYEERTFAFYAGQTPLTLEEVRRYDREGAVSWRFLEQRDWMRRIDSQAFDAAWQRAMDADGRSMSLDDQIRLHAKKDDSYLYGRIVETDQPHQAERAGQTSTVEGGLPDKTASIEGFDPTVPVHTVEANNVTVALSDADAARPVKLVPRGLGGFLYKALGFEEADKELGYLVIHDPCELQKLSPVASVASEGTIEGTSTGDGSAANAESAEDGQEGKTKRGRSRARRKTAGGTSADTVSTGWRAKRKDVAGALSKRLSKKRGVDASGAPVTSIEGEGSRRQNELFS